MSDKSSHNLTESNEVRELLAKVGNLDGDTGDRRLKQIVHRVVSDLCRTIDDFDVQPDQFWAAMAYLNRITQANELGLLVPCLGIETFLDLRLDAAERRAGLEGGTPRTIEGPLWIADAPLEKGEARLDDGSAPDEVLFIEGQVRDIEGRPIGGAIVDVWHANAMGAYSSFDPSQSSYNLRRRIETDGEGRYRLRTIMPAGYTLPADGPTQELLNRLGRRGRRPAHIHFMISAPGFRRLTTQINIDGDEDLHNDVAFATRDGLIPALHRISDGESLRARGLNAGYVEIRFDFVVHAETLLAPSTVVNREHAPAG